MTRLATLGALGALGTLSLGACDSRGAQESIDPALAGYIATIRAIDAHAHPMRPIPQGAPPDTDFDALPLDSIPPFSLPWRLRLDNPEWRAAQRTLYGVGSSDTGAAFAAALRTAMDRVQRARADRFPEWALDQAGIDVMLANRIALGAGLAPPRFRWVSFADPLMLPLDTRGEAARSPDTRSLYPKEARLLARYMKELGVAALPSTLEAYVKSVLTPALERQHSSGAVAVKFEAAYLRPLDFADPDRPMAERVYARFAKGGTPAHDEYKALEDYLFRVIAREAGRLGMGVQVHMTSYFGGFYSARGSAPYLMEPVFNDSTLRGTTFVIVHGGWPLVDETEAMLARPNVYADISAMVLFLEPSQVASVLRRWLVAWPEKVLFGTDAFDGGAAQGWADVAFFGAMTARHALAAALTGMMRDGEIDRARAEALARMVLRENALAAYHLAPAGPAKARVRVSSVRHMGATWARPGCCRCRALPADAGSARLVGAWPRADARGQAHPVAVGVYRPDESLRSRNSGRGHALIVIPSQPAP
jgi:predicted TIM-barrel fold metal-dependent hydrolase